MYNEILWASIRVRAAKMLVGEFRASKWGRLSLERPPQRAGSEEVAESAQDIETDEQ